MTEKRGKVIVIEGTDGSGKGTQVSSLIKRAYSEGIRFNSFDFPRYGTPTGRGVEDYLKGNFGNAVTLSPRLSAGFFALDRLAATPEIEFFLNKGIHTMMNRYTGSNLAHQGAKLRRLGEKKEFVNWCKNYEYNHLGIPKPDMFICLNTPLEVSAMSIISRGHEKDDHESNLVYQKEVVKTYLWLSKSQRDWRLVDSMDGSRRKTVDELTDEIWHLVRPILAN